MMALSVLGSALIAPPQTAQADAPESGTYVMLPVVQNGDGVTSLIAIQNTNTFTERFLITFYPSGKQYLTGTVWPKASYLVPQSAIPEGVSSATVETLVTLPVFTAVAPEFANLPIYFPPQFYVNGGIGGAGTPNYQTGPIVTQAIYAQTNNYSDLCAYAPFAAFVSQYFPQLPCRAYAPGTQSAVGLTTNNGYVWSYVLDLTNTEYLYVSSAATGAVVGYFISASAGQINGGSFVKLSDYLGVPGYDLFAPGTAVVVHRTDSTGPRVSEYEGIPFQRTTYTSMVPPGPNPLGGLTGVYPQTGPGVTNPASVGFIGQFGYNVFAPLVMKNYHGWNTRIWFMNYNRNVQLVITYYDQAGNPVFEETGYGLGTARTTTITGAGLPDGFVGTAWIASERYNAVVIDEYRDNPPMMMSYRAEASRTSLALGVAGGTGSTTFGQGNPLVAAIPGQPIANYSGTANFAVAPLILSRYHGWNTGIAVLNPNSFELRVYLNFRRENGGEQYVVSDRIPPRAMTPFYDSAWANLPENFVGNVQIVAEYSPGVPAGIVAIVNQVNYVRGMASAYNTIDAQFDVAGENDLPFITKGFQGYNSGVAVMNMNPNPGRLSGNFDVYTAAGILERTVFQADSLNTATVYLPNMYQVPNGFVGGAAVYIAQTNQAPANVFGFAPNTYTVATTQSVTGQYLPSGASAATLPGGSFPLPTYQNYTSGTGLAAVVNNVNYNGTGDTGATYGGVPVGGVFTGVGIGAGAGGVTGMVKNCVVGLGIPGLPVFVWNAAIVPAGTPPGLFLNAAVPVNAASSPLTAANVLPFNPALNTVNGVGTVVGTAFGSGNFSGQTNGFTTISGTVINYVPATPAIQGNLVIQTTTGQTISFPIPAGTTPITGNAQNPFSVAPVVGTAGTFQLTLSNGNLVNFSAGGSPTYGLTNTAVPYPSLPTLPGAFTSGLTNGTAFITFTDQNGQWTINGLPPGEYWFQVGGFSAACSPIGAAYSPTAVTVGNTPSQDQTFSYVAFTNSEAEKIIVNGNQIETAGIICMNEVGPIIETGTITGPAGPVNGAQITAETICPTFNGVFPSGLGQPVALGGSSLTAGSPLSSYYDAAYAAYKLATTGAPSASVVLNNGTPFNTYLPFRTFSGVGVNSPASGNVTTISVTSPVYGTITAANAPTFNITVPNGPVISPNAGGYVLALPWLGNYKKTVVAPGFNPQVVLASDFSAVNVTNINLGTQQNVTGTAPTPVLTCGTAGPNAGDITLTVNVSIPGTSGLVGATAGVTSVNALIYERLGGQQVNPQLRATVPLTLVGTFSASGNNQYTGSVTISGGGAGAVRTFTAQTQLVGPTVVVNGQTVPGQQLTSTLNPTTSTYTTSGGTVVNGANTVTCQGTTLIGTAAPTAPTIACGTATAGNTVVVATLPVQPAGAPTPTRITIIERNLDGTVRVVDEAVIAAGQTTYTSVPIPTQTLTPRTFQAYFSASSTGALSALSNTITCIGA